MADFIFGLTHFFFKLQVWHPRRCNKNINDYYQFFQWLLCLTCHITGERASQNCASYLNHTAWPVICATRHVMHVLNIWWFCVKQNTIHYLVFLIVMRIIMRIEKLLLFWVNPFFIMYLTVNCKVKIHIAKRLLD